MRPIPIHVTFKLGDRTYAVPCKSIEQARQLRDLTVHHSNMRYARINKSGRLPLGHKRIYPGMVAPILEGTWGRHKPHMVLKKVSDVNFY